MNPAVTDNKCCVVVSSACITGVPIFDTSDTSIFEVSRIATSRGLISEPTFELDGDSRWRLFKMIWPQPPWLSESLKRRCFQWRAKCRDSFSVDETRWIGMRHLPKLLSYLEGFGQHLVRSIRRVAYPLCPLQLGQLWVDSWVWMQEPPSNRGWSQWEASAILVSRHRYVSPDPAGPLSLSVSTRNRVWGSANNAWRNRIFGESWVRLGLGSVNVQVVCTASSDEDQAVPQTKFRATYLWSGSRFWLFWRAFLSPHGIAIGRFLFW